MRDSEMKPITMKITPGLSSLAKNPEGASEYIKPILDFILSKIPEDRHEFTGIYVLATAGMRLLSKETQNSIMDDIAEYIKSQSSFAKVKTSVISGADEGMYQWISVNAKLKKFLGANTNPETPTNAIIEMGGASIQITCQLRPGMEHQLEAWLSRDRTALRAAKSAVVEPQISREELEHNFKLISVTFLGFGSNSAREIYIDLLIRLTSGRWFNKLADAIFKTSYSRPRRPDGTLVINDPCMPDGLNETVVRPIRMLESPMYLGFRVKEGEKTFKVVLRGASRYKRCVRLMKKLLEKSKEEMLNCEPLKPCSMSLIGTHFVPFQRFQFLGLAEFYYTANAMDKGGEYEPKDFAKETEFVCNNNYEQLETVFPRANEVDPNRLRSQCFKAVWMQTFLTDAIKMPKDARLKTVANINGDALEWTLGAVLDKSLALDKVMTPLLAEKWDDLCTEHLNNRGCKIE